ncbi:MAG: FIST N-terminal domain-containing protein, partial [Planctomycetaceae bacterium]
MTQYGASFSKAPNLSRAVTAVCDEVAAQLGGAPPDLAFLFVSHAHAERFDDVASLICRQTRTRVLLGCTGETIVGGHQEIESGPALSLWSAVLPGAQIDPFHLRFSQTVDGVVGEGFPIDMGERRADVRAVFVLGEAYSSVPSSIIDRFADELPGVPLMGGMASGDAGPGSNRLFLNGECVRSGAVGAVVSGGPAIRSVVSQGCRPIGTTYLVTKADQNVVYELGSVPTMQRLRDLFATMNARDQRLMQGGLHLGIAMNEYQATFGRGDFLISNVIGAQPDDGAIAIGNVVRTGQTVQFHVRDAEAADEDLVALL